ncbi:MAG: hypothetical protein HRU15_04085, partial [Planctomycetes bacterium]|nr:hypothetical protein [Planctomycetota bacterium]
MSPTKISYVILMCWTLVLLSACARKDFGELKQQTQSIEQQHLYTDLHSSITAGHILLSKVLPEADAEIYVFSLQRNGARRIDKSIHQSDLWKENQALFFRVPSESGKDASADKWYYYQARTMNIIELETDQYSDSAQRTNNSFTIVRSVAVRHKPTFTQNELDVYTYTFAYDKNLRLRPHSHKRLTAHDGNNILPVLIPGMNRVAYSSTDDSGFSRVMTVSLEGGASTALISNGSVQSSHPRILSDNTLGFTANPDGYFRTYSYNFSSSSITVSSLRAKGSHNGDLVITNKKGSNTPILLHYPQNFDLESILTLVKAQNSSINRYRALLASELIQTRRSKLSVLPSLQFGAYYTPHAKTYGTTASGDFLAEGIARGIFGIVQDVFAIPRKLAMSESQLMRSEIVRDSLLDEINIRQAEAAELFFQAQLYQQLSEIDKVLLQIVKQEEQKQAHRQAHGQALSAEIMDEQGNVLAVQKRLYDHQRHLDLALNELKFMCALPMHKSIRLDTGIYQFEKNKIENFESLKRMAVLNHPKIQASRVNLHKAFFDRKAGGGRNPGLSIGAIGGQSYDANNGMNPVDDYITLSINAEVPLGFLKDKRLANSYWSEIDTALKLAQEQQTENI